MNDVRLTTSLEPTDKYLKARQDILKAIDSVNQLTPQQRQQLALEFSVDAIVLSLLSLR